MINPRIVDFRPAPPCFWPPKGLRSCMGTHIDTLGLRFFYYLKWGWLYFPYLLAKWNGQFGVNSIPICFPKTIQFVDSNPYIPPHPPLYSPSLHSNPVVPIYLMRREPISYFVISFCKMAHWQTRPLKNVANPQKLRRKLVRVASIPKASLGGLTVNYIFPRCFLTKVTVMMKKMIQRVRTQFCV